MTSPLSRLYHFFGCLALLFTVLIVSLGALQVGNLDSPNAIAAHHQVHHTARSRDLSAPSSEVHVEDTQSEYSPVQMILPNDERQSGSSSSLLSSPMDLVQLSDAARIARFNQLFERFADPHFPHQAKEGIAMPKVRLVSERPVEKRRPPSRFSASAAPRPTGESDPPLQCFAAVGIPSVDLGQSAQRRKGQRNSWQQYRAVRQGQILVRYILAKHPTNQYTYSEQLHAEAERTKDIIALKMREGVPTNRNLKMASGYWGFTSGLGISRKAFLWYRMAAFSNCSYVLKADDDMYWHVPQWLRDLHLFIPKTQVLWGKGMHYGCRKRSKQCTYFIVGMVLTMSRDVALAITHVAPFLELADKVEEDDSEEHLKLMQPALENWTYNHEDVMVGRLVRESNYPNVVMYDDYRFHDCHVGFLAKKPNRWSLVMHRCVNFAELYAEYLDAEEGGVNHWQMITENATWRQYHFGERRTVVQELKRVFPPGEPKWT